MPAAVAAVTMTLLLGGCFRPDEGRSTVLTFVNRSPSTVEISAAGQSGPFEILRPGETRESHSAPNLGNECTETKLIARDESGRVVDTRPSPMCEDETWLIGAD